MKKLLAVLVATAMIGIVAIPVLAGPFSDLPEESHWALDAIRMLAALGIIEGYPDGTYKGSQPATRYEVALIIARALEYLDRDIRKMSERMSELEGKQDGAPASVEPLPVTEPEPVLQPPATPDATILEQVIYEKIAAMSDEQWADFEEKLYELVAQVDDLSADNKAEHARLWEAVEALKEARSTTVVAVGDGETELALDEMKAQIMMAVYDAVNAERDERQRAIDDLKALLDVALAEQKAEIMMALHDSLGAEREDRAREIAELEGKFQLALDEQNAALTMAFYDSIRAAAEGDASALDRLAGEWQLALDERNAELTMAFYDSLSAAQDENARAIEDAMADVELRLAEQKAELMMALYDSVEAAKDEHARDIEDLESKWQLALDQQNAELMMAVYDSIWAAQEENAANLEAMDAKWQLALDQQNAELMMALYDSIWAAQEENAANLEDMEAKWQLALDQQNAELMMAFYDSIWAAQEENAANLEDMEARWQLALDEQNAALTMAFYDSLKAQREEILAALEDSEADYELALDELRAELMMAFYDSLRAEADERERAMEKLEEEFDLKLDELRAEMAMKSYDSIFAAREETLAEVDAVVATIEALQAEFSRELAALNVRVDALEAKTAEHDDKISEIWDDLNRFRFSGSDTVEFTDIDLYGPAGAAEHYMDPWARTKVYEPTSKLQNKLALTLNIVPEAGVNVDVGLNVITDIYGLADEDATLFNGDLNLSLTTPSGKAKMVAGDLARPRNFTKYQMSRKVFADAGVEGLSLDLETGPFVTTGMIAKINPLVEQHKYVLGGGASYTVGNLTVDGRLLKIVDDPESNVISADLDERILGAGFALKLGGGFKVNGEVSSWSTSDPYDAEAATDAALARGVFAGGKLGILNLNGYFEQIDEGYAPKYLGTAANDPDRVVADTRGAGFGIETDSIDGLILSGSIDRAGDAGYETEDATTYAAGAKYGLELGPVDVTLRGGAEHERAAKPEAGVTTTTDLGFDVAWEPLEAGFTWEHEIGDGTSYIGYANLDWPIAADTLTLKGNWEQSFGSKEYYTYGVGLGMKMPLAEDIASLKADLSYGKTHGMPKDKDNYAKFFVGAGLDWKLRPATTLTGTASYETRGYEVSTQPSGQYLQYGLALSHEIYKSTTLKANYDFKDVYYSGEDFNNYSLRIVGLSLKTVF
jgi:hypothetical protein